MPRQVDRQEDELQGLVQQIQGALLVATRRCFAFDENDFIENGIPVVQSALDAAKVNPHITMNLGKPPEGTWHPGADFGNVRVVIQVSPRVELRYFLIEENEDEEIR